jgi:hypothetical protein
VTKSGEVEMIPRDREVERGRQSTRASFAAPSSFIAPGEVSIVTSPAVTVEIRWWSRLGLGARIPSHLLAADV